MAEMVVNGVSTRKVSKVMEKLCGTSFSKSAVSNVYEKLNKEVETYRNRLLTGNYPFLTIDATYIKVRENRRIVSKSAHGCPGDQTNEQGLREVLGFNVYPEESLDTWKDFLRGLKKRGLAGMLMITSDAHKGILNAIAEVHPDAA